MAGDLNQQLGIQESINKLLAQRASMIAQQNQLLSAQAQYAKEICKAMDCEDLDDLDERLGSIKDSLAEAADKASEMGNEIDAAGNKGAEAGKKAAEEAEKVGSAWTNAKVAAAGFAVGIGAGIKSSISQVKGLIKGLGSIVGVVGKVGKAIIGIPFGIMRGLVGMAQAGGGGGPNPIKVALEEIREEFGSLASNEGKALAGSLDNLRGNMKDFAGTGLKLSKIYGRGKKGLAEAMKDLAATAKAMGPVFSALKDEFENNAASILAFKKGLNIADDAMKALGQRALSSGKSLNDTLLETASLSINMGKAFGVSAKIISKGMQEMTKDFSNFGSLSQKELGATAVYAHKLGMEIKDMMGVIDKFDNFEDAAKGASMLAQSFGMNVDAMALMNAQSPAERIDLLRKSFFDAGKSIQDMTRQERKLLEQQTGLTGQALEAAFANENMGVSYDDVMEGAEDAEKKQLTQAEAMKELADSIKKMTGGGGGGTSYKSFFDAFVQGFSKGVKKSKPFRQMLKNIRKSLKIVNRFGRKMGKMFVNMFPGVKKMVTSLRDLFDPKKFKKLTGELLGVFKTFFKDIKDDPKAGVRKLLDSMKKIFGDFFSSNKGAAAGLKEGFMTFIKTFGLIILSLVPYIIRFLTAGLVKLINFIKNPKGFGGVGGAMSEQFSQAFDDIKETLPALVAALKDLLAMVWAKAGPPIKAAGKKILKLMLIKILIGAALSAVKGIAVKAVIGLFVGFFKLVTKATAAKAPAPPPPTGGKGFAAGMNSFFKSLGSIKATSIIKASIKLAMITVMFLPQFLVFVIGFVKGVMIAMAGVNPLKFVGYMIGLSYGLNAFRWFLTTVTYLKATDIIKATFKLILVAAFFYTAGILFLKALKEMVAMMSTVGTKAVIGTMAALAVSALATMALIKFAAMIPEGQAVSAAIGLLVSVPVLLAAIPFALAVGLLTMMYSALGINPIMVMGVMIALAIAAASMVVLFVAGAILGVLSGLVPLAMLGLVAGAALILVGGIAFTLAIVALAPFLAGVPWGMVALAFFAMAVVMASLVIIEIAAIAAGILAIPAMIAMIFVGMFMASMITDMVPQLIGLSNSFAGVDFLPLAKAMGTLVFVMMALAVIGLFTMAAGIACLIGMIFLPIVGAFIGNLNLDVMPQVERLANSPGLKAIGANIEGVKALAILFPVLALIAFMSLMLMIFAVPFIGGWLMKTGIGIVKKFIIAITDNIMPAVMEMAKTKVADPKGFQQQMDAVGKILGMVGDLGEIAVSLAEIDADAMEEGGKQGGTIRAITKFITVLMEGTKDLIMAIVKQASGIPLSSVKKVKAVGGLIGEIGKLIGALMEPMPELMKTIQEASTTGGSWFKRGKTDSSKMMNMMAMMGIVVGMILSAIRIHVVKMIQDLVKIKMPGKPSAIAAKLKVMSLAMDVVAKFGKTLGDLMKIALEIQKAHNKSISWWSSKKKKGLPDAMKMFSDMMGTLGEAIGEHLPPLVKKIVKAANDAVGTADPKVVTQKMKIVAMAMEAVSTFGTVLQGLLKDFMGTRKFDLGKGKELVILMHNLNYMIKKIVDSIKAHLPPLILAIVGVAEGIKDPAKAKAGMEVVLMSFKAVSAFAKAMGDLMNIAPKAEKVENVAAQADAVQTVIAKLVIQLVDPKFGMVALVNAVIGIAQGVGAGMKEKMEVVVMAMKAVSSFAKAISDIMGIAKIDEGGNVGEHANSVMGAVNTIMGDENSGLIKHLPKIIEKLRDVAADIGDPKTMKPKMEIVAMTMDIISKFASAMKDMMSIDPPPKEGEVKAATERATSVATTIGTLIDKLKTKLPELIEKISGINLGRGGSRGLKKKAQAMSHAMTALVDFSVAIKALQGLQDVKAKGDLATQVGKVIDQTIRILAPAKGAEGGGTLQDLGIAVGKLKISAPKLKTAAAAAKSMAAFLADFSLAKTNIASITKSSEVHLATEIATVIADLEATHKQLASTKITLRGTVKKFGKALNVTKETIKITNKPIHIHVQLQLKMDKNSIVTSLSKGSPALVKAGG